MRTALAVLFAVLGAVLLFVAVGALADAFRSHPDGPRWAYAVFGLVELGLALLPLRFLWRLFRTNNT
jgi:hypothetical protein